LRNKDRFETPYVSRGGLKLEKAFFDFNLTAENKKAADVGSSTGGFTDFLLQNGASQVIAIDVGYGIIAWKLRQDKRVHLLERTNIKNVVPDKLPYLADITVVDLSFISVKTVFKKILEITDQKGIILLLVKPQFEAPREDVQKGGIVKDKDIHFKVLSELLSFICNFEVELKGITFSKIRGAKGNIEFWIFLGISHSNIKKTVSNYDKMVRKIVNEAHMFYEMNPGL
jgi:23S rRNA (cytidine1920-2'-O)/16S rRNA (cytidine1409-2'-O)-methyltransferase